MYSKFRWPALALAAAIFTGPALSVLFASSASAGYIFEELYPPPPNDARHLEAAEDNSDLLGVPVDYVGKFEGGSFTAYSDAANPFENGDIAVTESGGEWTWEIVDAELAAIWDIVKIGVFQSQMGAYFLVEPPADSDTFTMSDLNALILAEFPDFDGWSGLTDNNGAGAFSNIAFFGTQGDGPDNVPEPGPLALLGLGLVGFALARRRR